MKIKNKKLIVILGPTATGKTKLAVRLASEFNGEIISADSRQVFRGMDIGTGKDLGEYSLKPLKKPNKALGAASRRPLKASKGLFKVPYHLIDIISPKTEFNVAKYQKMAYKAIEGVQETDKIPFLVGGTGLYIDAVIKGYSFSNFKFLISNSKGIRQKLDQLNLRQLLARLKKVDPETYDKIDKKNRRRVQRALEIYYETGKKKSEAAPAVKPDYDILIIGLKFPMEEIYKKIDSRLENRIKEGMIKEIKKLRREGVSWKRMEEFGLEYRYVSRYVRGLITYEELIDQLKREIHHFAKRQMTWFKRNPEIKWVSSYKEARNLIKDFKKNKTKK